MFYFESVAHALTFVPETPLIVLKLWHILMQVFNMRYCILKVHRIVDSTEQSSAENGGSVPKDTANVA